MCLTWNARTRRQRAALARAMGRGTDALYCRVLQSVAECCRVLQSVAACCRALQRVAERCSVLQSVVVCLHAMGRGTDALCCKVLQCTAVCCSMLQGVIVHVLREHGIQLYELESGALSDALKKHFCVLKSAFCVLTWAFQVYQKTLYVPRRVCVEVSELQCANFNVRWCSGACNG